MGNRNSLGGILGAVFNNHAGGNNHRGNNNTHVQGGVSIGIGRDVRIGVGGDSRGNVGIDVEVGDRRGGYGNRGGGTWDRGRQSGVFNRAASREDLREIQSAYGVERRTLQEIQNADRTEIRNWHKQELDNATKELEQQGLDRYEIRRALIPLRHDQNHEQAQLRLVHQRQNEALTEIYNDGRQGHLGPQQAINEMHDFVERIYHDSGAVPQVEGHVGPRVHVSVGGGLEF